MPRYFSRSMSLVLYRPVSLCPCGKLKLNYTQWGWANGLSISTQVMEQSLPHTAASKYLYLFFYLHFKPPFSNRAETELKCNTGFREHIKLAFYHIETVGA